MEKIAMNCTNVSNTANHPLKATPKLDALSKSMNDDCVEKPHAFIHENRDLTVHKAAEEARISKVCVILF